MRDLFINTLFIIINLYKKKLCYLPKKRMDMGKCTSYILYIKQNPTTYKETTISQRNSALIAAFLLESSTTNQSMPNNIIYSSPLPFSPKNWSSTES